MKRLLFLAVCTLCIGCSDDNSGTIIDISEEFLFPDFTVVSFDDDAFYAFDFDLSFNLILSNTLVVIWEETSQDHTRMKTIQLVVELAKIIWR